MNGACKKALTIPKQRCAYLISIPCACYGLDQMFEKIFGQSGKSTMKQQEWAYKLVQSIEFVVTFVLNHEFSLGLDRKYSHSADEVR